MWPSLARLHTIYSDMERNPDNVPVAGALLVRIEAALLYFNVGNVRDAIWEGIRAAPGTLTLVVCDLSTSPILDMAGAQMLQKLHEELQAAGIRLVGSAPCGGARHPACGRPGGTHRLFRQANHGG